MNNRVTMTVPLDQLKDRVCKCGGVIFVSALTLKELPPVYSPSGKYETSFIPAGFACIRCGALLSLRPEGPKIDEMTEEESEVKSDSKIVLAG